ncbi:hypothetical protein B0T16DRAFT_320664 [Cercophora newfieldiana]|uniref:F-box domain-containing protein n=1 Tax=Cercophora newfieldiana TaxID=92897 RepID=A0AA39YI19_9PEZI|nr:hypothetical protein B0T16DRAFT_320664 [Cercophora newfieldiana]
MKLFRRKDKGKSKSQSGMPALGAGFGSGPGGLSSDFSDDARAGGSRFFGSSPSGTGHLGQFRSMATPKSAYLLAHLPPKVLWRIFAFVCPHSQDESYDTCEESSVEDACMLCDLRDLAHCVSVSKIWRKEARSQLYRSIRIDMVHYCEREAILSERRKRRSFFDRNGEPEDTSQARLKLLCRTLREDPVRLGQTVEFLKMPYMLRESCQVDLAKTIAVTPNLRYVDLPEGLFTDDPSFLTLRLEVQARCLHLRKMTYMSGSERSLQSLASGTVWTHLEVLELIKINMDPALIRQVLGCLLKLRALKISQTPYINDQTLAWNDMLPPFPALEEFILNDVPNVTAEGLRAWLVMPEAREALKVITLNKTGVQVSSLHEVLAYAPHLKHMSVMNSVHAAMPTMIGQHNIPHLSSTSLETLHYEILAGPGSPNFSGVTSSYYGYLSDSLLSGGLPSLRAVYVHDPDFPDLLLGLAPPIPSFAEGAMARPASSGSSHGLPSRYGHGSTGSFSSNLSPKSLVHAGLTPSGTAPGLSSPQQRSFAPAQNPRFSSNNPFASMINTTQNNIANLPAKLEVFTKGEDDNGWSFSRVEPGMAFAARQSGASGRPLSSYGLGADVLGGNASGWSSGAGARRSVLVNNRTGGGFLAVPPESNGARGRSGLGAPAATGGAGGEDYWPSPIPTNGEKKKERLDLWR